MWGIKCHKYENLYNILYMYMWKNEIKTKLPARGRNTLTIVNGLSRWLACRHASHWNEISCAILESLILLVDKGLIRCLHQWKSYWRLNRERYICNWSGIAMKTPVGSIHMYLMTLSEFGGSIKDRSANKAWSKISLWAFKHEINDSWINMLIYPYQQWRESVCRR